MCNDVYIGQWPSNETNIDFLISDNNFYDFWLFLNFFDYE